MALTHLPTADIQGNISIRDGISSKLQLIQKVDFIKNKIQKAIFLMKGESNAYKTGLTFGFNSTKCPPQVKGLASFEKDLIKLLKDLRF